MFGNHTVDLIVQIVDLIGVFANAILGGISARLARLDFFGFSVIAIASGLGGGMIRDALLQQGTAAALTDPYYLIVSIGGAALVLFVPFKSRGSQRLLVVMDALAIGCWAAVGTERGIGAGLGWLPSIMVGVITTIGGGMVRDLLLGRRPSVFGGNTLYATSAILASAEMLVCSELGLAVLGLFLAITSGATLSLLARRFHWILPTAPQLHLVIGHHHGMRPHDRR
ncbi:MAG: trimeric intracellular cation channel family protein [Microbacteriaceae bacterium]|jgi:uncharacterized membrane protein YeiH|nr:trimeric intracellular cation channel family protein [Microbacteriaceae bacterium]MCI1206889.1 trimeric intracellular cation channel family protein [Microbacteriaceae bacterium]